MQQSAAFDGTHFSCLYFPIHFHKSIKNHGCRPSYVIPLATQPFCSVAFGLPFLFGFHLFFRINRIQLDEQPVNHFNDIFGKFIVDPG